MEQYFYSIFLEADIAQECTFLISISGDSETGVYGPHFEEHFMDNGTEPRETNPKVQMSNT